MHSLLLLKGNKNLNRLLIFILLISFLNEVLSYFLVQNNQSIALNSSIYAFLLLFSWLYLILIYFDSQIYKIILGIFTTYSLLNIFVFDGFQVFNTHTFLIGAIFYLAIFGYNLYSVLKKEKFNILKTNDFILVLSPVLFLFGFSLIFSFKTKQIDTVVIFNSFTLYTFISYFVNIIYYSLINLYIYKERKIQHA